MSAITLPSPPADPQSPSIPCAPAEGACPGRLGVLIPFLSSDFQLLTFNFQPSYAPNSFPLNSFADHHPLNPAMSIFYKKGGGVGPSPDWTFQRCAVQIGAVLRLSGGDPDPVGTFGPPHVSTCFPLTYCPAKPFRINTHFAPSWCHLSSFRMNTSKVYQNK